MEKTSTNIDSEPQIKKPRNARKVAKAIAAPVLLAVAMTPPYLASEVAEKNHKQNFEEVVTLDRETSQDLVDSQQKLLEQGINPQVVEQNTGLMTVLPVESQPTEMPIQQQK